jgi:hypothetical protein
VSIIRAHHLIRHHFKGDLVELQETLYSLANLVLAVNNHEVLAELDENDYLERIAAARAASAKGRRLTRVKKRIEDATLESKADRDQNHRRHRRL